MNKQRSYIDGTGLKLLAMVTMVADHLGDALFPGVTWLRIIGRIAMPIFSFMIAEGYAHTHDRLAYLKRLLIFALISEIPFDLFAHGKLFDLSQQNIIFTFAWAITGLLVFEAVRKKTGNKFLPYLVPVVFMALSILLRLDYNAGAVAVIFVYHLLKDRPLYQRNTAALIAYLFFRNMGIYLYGFLGFLPIFLYNGKRGKGFKWLFYVFYPAHLLLIYLLKLLVG